MPRLGPIALAGLCLAAAAPAAAQTWDRHSYDGGYVDAYGWSGHGPDAARGDWRDGSDWNAVPSAFDWRSQLDRPGDYRCDAYWDARRSDCGERWRDQRHRVSPQARRDYRELAGYRYDGHGGYAGYAGYGYDRRDPYGHDRYGGGHRPYVYDRQAYDRYGSWRRGYGSTYASGGATWHAAYGRPDVVFPGGGYGHGGRDPGLIAWCRATYRSYDPGSGYYRAWSGRLIWCG